MSRRKKRNYNCKHEGCQFKTTGPTQLGAHYRQNPSHAPTSSISNPNPNLTTLKQRANRKKDGKLSMTAGAIRHRSRRYSRRDKGLPPVPRKYPKNLPSQPAIDPEASCNYCPCCGTFLSPLNAGMAIANQLKKG